MTSAIPVPARFTEALVSTAGHCKIACGFCLRPDRAPGYLKIATYTRTLSRLKEMGVEGVCLTGGEPAHHPQLRDLIRLAHQFGLAVSVVTSARAEAEVAGLARIGHLLANLTVSADSTGAMHLGRTTRSVKTALATLRAVPAPAKVLHLTYWDMSDTEARAVHTALRDAEFEVQLSPVMLDPAAQAKAGLSLDEYVQRQRNDTDHLAHYFQFSPRFQKHLTALHAMLLHPRSVSCRSSLLYVSMDGHLRRCPYGTTGVPVQAPRTVIRDYLAAPPGDKVTPDCAAICRATR
ncbi:radical SAM protein [Streptomyces sp. ERV7]|uniref:radical SAM protein n=1 Tax=Streptomyces sp. ERV7 TaxID=1322334 RepID=UPI0007F4B8E1|nr:radical SAM protein [Streptomyces sp. ERV7]OAR22207.1 radical SAM protein [Streptomyces sp. ERV7]